MIYHFKLPKNVLIEGDDLAVSDNPMFSGGGTQPPPKPHAPVKKPGKKPKKK